MNPRALSGLKLNCIILYVNLAIFMQPQCDVSELSEGGIMAGHISALTSTARHGLLLLTLNLGLFLRSFLSKFSALFLHLLSAPARGAARTRDRGRARGDGVCRAHARGRRAAGTDGTLPCPRRRAAWTGWRVARLGA